MKRLILHSVIIFAVVVSLFSSTGQPAPAASAAAAASGWTWQNPLPQGNDLQSVSALDESHVWAVGDSGTILFFDGASWQPQDSGTDTQLYGVCAYDESHVWAVGQYSILFYDGAAWKQQSSQPGKTLRSVYVLDLTHVWAVGREGVVLFYDGSNWSRQTSSSSKTLNAVHALDPSHVWAVGWDPLGSDDSILFFNGTTWTTDQHAGTDAWLDDVSAVSESQVWAVGEGGLILYYDGSTWSPQASGVTNALTGISFYDANHLWAVGTNGTVLTGDGTSWTQVEGGYFTSLNAVSVFRPNRIWAVGMSGGIIFCDAVWGAQSSGPSFLYPGGISAVDADHVWATISEPGKYVLFYDGSSWQYVDTGLDHFGLNDVSALDPNHVWAVGEGKDICFFNGSTWSQQYADYGSLEGVCALDASHVWAVGADGAVLFFNGTSWQAQDSGITKDLYGVCALDASHVWAVGQDGAVVFYNGSSWQPQASGTPEILKDVSAADASHAWAVGNNGALLFYDGNAWSSQLDVEWYWLNDVCAVDASHVWAAGDSGVVLFYDGSTWTEQATPTDREFYGVSVLDQGQAWVIGYSGCILADTGPPVNVPTTWYLAEGCTAGGIETWALVQNPSGSPAEVSLVFQTDSGEVQGPRETIPAKSRRSYNVGAYVESYNVSTVVASSGSGVVCERACYGNGRQWGTDSIGATSPATAWYLAEGASAGGFETWVLVQNPGSAAVDVDMVFQTDTGQVQGPRESIPAKSRRSYNVGQWARSYNVSTRVTASGAGVVCERAMYGNGRAWGHDSIGATAPAPGWYLAEGCSAGDFETWVLVQNPGSAAVDVSMFFMTDSGLAQGPIESIPARSRRSYNVGDYVQSYNVSTRVTSTGGDIVCERAMYGNGRQWGHDSIGATARATAWYLAEGCSAGDFETWVLVQNPGTTDVTVDVVFQTDSGEVQGPHETIPAVSRRSYNVGDYVQSYNVSTRVAATGQGVVCERAMYGNGRTWGHDSIGYPRP